MRKMIPRRKPPLLQNDRVAVHHGGCLEVMAAMPEASVDTVVTDPPYHLTQASRGGSPRKPGNGPAGRHHVGESGFMGKTWDGGGIAFDPETWRAALRVAKPGAILLAFGGTRTFHRLACAVEDAGWELRDALTLFYAHGSGFPKSYNIGVAFERELCERVSRTVDGCVVKRWVYKDNGEDMRTKPPFRRAEANTWWGWGTALKPAYEIILCAQKPLDGSGFCDNALRHGVAGLWIDGGRIGWKSQADRDGLKRLEGYKGVAGKPSNSLSGGVDGSLNVVTDEQMIGHSAGRWPANLILQHSPDCVRVGTAPDPGYVINRFKDGAKPFGDGAGCEYESEAVPASEREVYACVPGCPVRMLNGQSGQKSSSARPNTQGKKYNSKRTVSILPQSGEHNSIHGDSGGASRFFYTAKASTTERVLGCPPGFRNNHPTVKPLDLCRYLCRLTRTPTGGVVLDPFSGSGSIAVAALLEGRTAIAIELEEESARCTVGRVEAALKYGDKLQGLKRYRLKGRKRLKRGR